MNLDAFQQSAFLQSLGWAIANSIWQGAILWVLYHFVVSFYTNASAKFKNNSGTLFLFGSFLWFVKSFFNKFIYLQQTSNELIKESMTFFAGFYSITAGISLKSIISFAVLSLPFLSFAYLLLLMIFSIKLINSYRNTQYIKSNGLRKPPAEWRLFAEKVATHIGINKGIKIWFSRNVDVPATIGYLKPVILIPVASLNQLSTDQLEAIILHELSHIKRNDYLINLFISLIETILFFNPFVFLLIKIIKKERENCCDDFVLQYQYDRHSYASALLSLEHCRNQHLRLALNSTSGKKQLLFRIKRIMEANSVTQSFNYGQKLLALVLTTGIICSVAWLAPAKQTNFYNKISEKEVRDVKPVMAKEKQDNFLRRSYKEPPQSFTTIKSKVKKNNFIAAENFSEIYSPSSNGNISYQAKKNAFSPFNSDKEQQRDILVKVYENDKKAPVRETLHNSEALFALHDNVYLKQLPDFDFQLFEDVEVNIDIKRLKADIQKQYLSLLKIDWDDINEEINKNLSKIEKSKLEMLASEKQKMHAVREMESYQENIQTKLQLRLKRASGNMMTWNKKLTHVDSLINDSQVLFNLDEEMVFFKETQDNLHFHTLPPPIIKKKFIAVPRPVTDHQLNFDKVSFNNYHTVKKKNRSNADIIKDECEAEAAATNKRRVNSERLNKHVPGATDKKFVVDISGSKFEFEIEY